MQNLADNTQTLSELGKSAITDIEQLDDQLANYFSNKFVIQTSLTRSMVSFQANKNKANYRWFKYKEGFSASLVEYLFHRYKILSGRILDPFAGSGTALFAASAVGINAEGIELLPIGQQIINTRKLLEFNFKEEDLTTLKRWAKLRTWEKSEIKCSLPELGITKGAYPQQTQEEIKKYMSAWQQENDSVQAVLRFVLLCVLESVSYTRKDGQYLRWDYRADRRETKKPFDKGKILSFQEAICQKIDEILFDLQPQHEQLELFPNKKNEGDIYLHSGSCLDILPTLPDSLYNAIITSPPYCNRYDYTRTYALELALLGINEQELIKLRQQMLSCTVENQPKDLLKINSNWTTAIDAANQQELLQAILKYLEEQKAQGLLNNNGIPRMVRGYFYEMAVAIASEVLPIEFLKRF